MTTIGNLFFHIPKKHRSFEMVFATHARDESHATNRQDQQRPSTYFLKIPRSTAILVLFSITFGFFAGGYSSIWGGFINELESEAARRNEAIEPGMVYDLLNGARGIGHLLKAGRLNSIGGHAYCMDRPVAPSSYSQGIRSFLEDGVYYGTLEGSPYAKTLRLNCSTIGHASDQIFTISSDLNCTLGDQPVYTVNATESGHVAKGIEFARKYNIRLVIRDTGHDLLRRSTGYGSLQIWIRYLRNGIDFQKAYTPSAQCSRSTWAGSAFRIGGGYTWSDVLAEAASRGVVVVGGGTPVSKSVGCLGGWMQGGGHGPAAHDFGLGADQVLEAEVVTTSGQVVTASPCQHPGLFFAIRGGGGGTYGVVLSTTVKAHPTTKVAAQQLSFAPLNSSYVPEFMKAVELLYNAYPDLSDNGFSGYGSWSIESPTPLVYNYNYTLGGPIEANFTIGFTHTVSLFGKTAEEARSLFAPIAAQLAPFNGKSLFINTTYSSFPTYAAFYSALSGIEPPIGTSAAIGSRLLDRKALTSRRLNESLYTIAGTPEQFTSVNIVFVGGGQVARDGDDKYSGVNPAWRTSYVHNIVARGWAPGADEATKGTVYRDITDVKVRAMKDLAPDTGAYMNEDFYGKHAKKLSSIKKKYDPMGVFYCPTCIGSEQWEEESTGRLCRSK
ncbi:MAG: hypothetical protein Q9212_002379 [Teloschistes hypoglaucus]